MYIIFSFDGVNWSARVGLMEVLEYRVAANAPTPNLFPFLRGNVLSPAFPSENLDSGSSSSCVDHSALGMVNCLRFA